MKFLKLRESLLCLAVFMVMFWSASAPAQVIIAPQDDETMPDAQLLQIQPGKSAERAVATDAKPEKRNPFWPIDLKLQEKIATANVNDQPQLPPHSPPKAVDWNEAKKFVKENKKLSSIAGKIHLAFNGRIYQIDSLMDVTIDGNIYTFKVGEGGEIAQHGVRPVEN